MEIPDDAAAGYQIIGGILDDQEIWNLLRALEDSLMTRSRGGVRHLMGHPQVQRVARDQRLLAIAAGFLGAAPVPYRATLFDKSPDRNWLVAWHQDKALPLETRRDLPGWGPWSVKSGVTYAHAPTRALCRIVALRVHFDDSSIDNGPLRVIPGTHRLGVLSSVQIHQIVQSTSPVDCLVGAGGIVAMRPLTLHASSKAETAHPRRVLHIEYAASLDVDGGLRLAIA